MYCYIQFILLFCMINSKQILCHVHAATFNMFSKEFNKRGKIRELNKV